MHSPRAREPFVPPGGVDSAPSRPYRQPEMNGVHDMGGTHGFGPIRPRENEDALHGAVERGVPAMAGVVRSQGVYNIDESRHGIERIPPAQYLASGYFERWLSSLKRNLVEKGVLTTEEIEARTAELERNP